MKEKECFKLAYRILNLKVKNAKSAGKLHYRFCISLLSLVENGREDVLKRLLEEEKNNENLIV